jgi:hypothetical protein
MTKRAKRRALRSSRQSGSSGSVLHAGSLDGDDMSEDDGDISPSEDNE